VTIPVTAFSDDIEIIEDSEVFVDKHPKERFGAEFFDDEYFPFTWEEDVLAVEGIVRLTDELYDEEIWRNHREFAKHDPEAPKETKESKPALTPWLVFFTIDLQGDHFPRASANSNMWRRFNDVVQNMMRDLNGKVNKFDKNGEMISQRLKIAYVDIIDNGELVKIAFDIPTVPAAVIIRDGKFYVLKQSIVDKIFDSTSANSMIFSDYIETGYLDASYDYLRARPLRNNLIWEYVFIYFSEKYFSDIMEYYRSYRVYMRDNLGYESVSLKTVNPNFGKKNSYQRSQVRTLYNEVIWYWLALFTAIFSALLFVCMWRCIGDLGPVK